MIMYAGRPAEIGPRDEFFERPRHPYSWGLLESIPRPDVRVERLVPIDGAPPSLIHVPPGCAFHPRCPHRFAPCDTDAARAGRRRATTSTHATSPPRTRCASGPSAARRFEDAAA